MDSDKKMDVVDWQDSPPPVVPKKRAPRRFLSPTLIGMLGTFLLHTMVIQSLPLGNRGPKAKPPEAQLTADAASKFKADPTESLVLITLPDAAHSREAAIQNVISALGDLSKMKIKSSVIVDPPAFLNLEMLALSEDQASDSRAEGGNAAEQARLSGIYTGQIQARIARVWRRPRSPVKEDSASQNANDVGESFQCDAQIVQDAKGNVQEILLPRCNGSPAWRNSLVLAIQHASPLPAPPSAGVFSQSITLNFIGVSFIAGDAEDDYEPERRALTGAQ
jgi:hypothetical protein